MYEVAKINGYRVTKEGTEFKILIPGVDLEKSIKNKHMNQCGVWLEDGRHITADQRKKIYATIADISQYLGYLPEECKEWMKYLHIANTGCEYFSFKDCSIDTAREFINTIIEFSIINGVQLQDLAINRTDDIGKYLWYCLKHKKCAICGKQGEIHHVDAIGMGNDRTELDDSNHRKLCLCRTHHTIAHQKGMPSFEKSYKVYGIIFKEDG
jgi:hypothetical protein